MTKKNFKGKPSRIAHPHHLLAHLKKYKEPTSLFYETDKATLSRLRIVLSEWAKDWTDPYCNKRLFDYKKAAQMRNQGKSLAEIGKKLGVGRSAVWYGLRKYEKENESA